MQGVCYRPRRRKRRKSRLILLLLFSALFLVSCVAGSNALWIRGLFGIDLADYRAEAVEATLPADGAVADSLCDIVNMLAVDRVELKTFSKNTNAVKDYRDEILGYMLREGYSKYTGNADAIREVAKAYPNMTISTLIPAADFENTASRYFGLQSVRHGDGELFTYLEKAGYYTFSMNAWESRVRVVAERVEETYHTYRLYFHVTDGTETSDPYVAIFVKRDDGSVYMRALEYDR